MLRLLWGGLKGALRQPYLAFSRSRGRIVRPMVLDCAVTWRCNARCVMCDTWQAGRDNPELAQAELSPDQLAAILERDAEFIAKVKKVGLTGGEPFLRPDLAEIVRVWHRALPEARISVVSNGLMTGRILETLEQIRGFLPRMVFSVSLDGLGEIHDQVRGVPGAYDKALAAIRGARELGFTVTSGMTISGLNYDQVQPVSQLLGGLGVDFSCNLQERGANFHNDGRARDLTPEQKEQVARSLEPFAHHYYMDNVRAQLKGRTRTLPCYSGFTSYFLAPDGKVNLCNLVGRPLGDLRENKFRDIAEGARAWRLREEYKDCKCWSQCEVKNSAAAAPWHVFKWMLTSPRKAAFFRRYAKNEVLPPH